MKQYPWTEESVAFMCRAADRSEYHAMLAAHIAPYLSGTETVYEPGCGTGDLSLALAPYVHSLIASDIDPLPLEALKKRMAERGIGNITVLTQDALSLPSEQSYEAAVFCFFAMPEQILAFARAHVEKHVFVIKRAYKKHRFAVEDTPITGDSLEKMCALLEKERIPYEKELLSAENGQPLRDLAEARRFFRLYGREGADTDLSDAALLARLTVTDDKEFPYYLPGRKEVGLIHFSAEDL